MKRMISLLAVFLLLNASPLAWAGPEDEIARLLQQLDQAFNEGNLEAYMAPYADQAVFTPPNVPFRIEGKQAIRAYYAGVLQAFPTRQVVPRQPAIQIYADTTAIVSRYNQAMFVDRSGKVTNFYVRQSYTWVKLGERWTLIEQHYSALPVPP
jgi:uncharacterized protein (TIGR02246 family)